MAGRGGGRGRGRGRGAISFDTSQLGFGAGETLPAPVLQPPPLFPPLEHKPVPLKSGPESEYMVALRRDFVEYLKYSLSLKPTSEANLAIERFSDKYHSSSLGKDNWDTHYYWDRLPSELRPKSSKVSKRKLEKPEVDKGSRNSKKRNIDISSKLDALAKIEEKVDEDSEEVKDTEGNEEDEDNDDENPEEEEDDEMDDGTDYVNSYFDNGEGYFDDEDDNLDDGPVY